MHQPSHQWVRIVSYMTLLRPGHTLLYLGGCLFAVVVIGSLFVAVRSVPLLFELSATGRWSRLLLCCALGCRDVGMGGQLGKPISRESPP